MPNENISTRTTFFSWRFETLFFVIIPPFQKQLELLTPHYRNRQHQSPDISHNTQRGYRIGEGHNIYGSGLRIPPRILHCLYGNTLADSCNLLRNRGSNNEPDEHKNVFADRGEDAEVEKRTESLMVPLMRKYITLVTNRYTTAGTAFPFGIAYLCFPVPSLTPRYHLVRFLSNLVCWLRVTYLWRLGFGFRNPPVLNVCGRPTCQCQNCN